MGGSSLEREMSPRVKTLILTTRIEKKYGEKDKVMNLNQEKK